MLLCHDHPVILVGCKRHARMLRMKGEQDEGSARLACRQHTTMSLCNTRQDQRWKRVTGTSFNGCQSTVYVLSAWNGVQGGEVQGELWVHWKGPSQLKYALRQARVVLDQSDPGTLHRTWPQARLAPTCTRVPCRVACRYCTREARSVETARWTCKWNSCGRGQTAMLGPRGNPFALVLAFGSSEHKM